MPPRPCGKCGSTHRANRWGAAPPRSANVQRPATCGARGTRDQAVSEAVTAARNAARSGAVRGLLAAGRRFDQPLHARDVLGVLGQPPLVARAGLGAHERERSAATFGHMLDIELLPVDDPMQVRAQVLAQREARRARHRVVAEIPQLVAVFAATAGVGGDGPVTRRRGRFRAARQQSVGRVPPQPRDVDQLRRERSDTLVRVVPAAAEFFRHPGDGGVDAGGRHDAERPRRRPQHQRGAAVRALDGRAGVAGGFLDALFVRLGVVECAARQPLLGRQVDLAERRTMAVGADPAVQPLAVVFHLLHLQVVVRRTPAPVRKFARIRSGSPFFEMQNGRVQRAVGLSGCRYQHARESRVPVLQRVERQTRLAVFVLEHPGERRRCGVRTPPPAPRTSST